MSDVLVPLLVSAALFALWGLVARLQRRAPECGGCTSACPTKEGSRASR